MPNKSQTKLPQSNKKKIISTAIGRLVLTRKLGESVYINGDMEVKLLSMDKKRGQIKLAFTAPKDIAIVRKELYRPL